MQADQSDAGDTASQPPRSGTPNYRTTSSTEFYSDNTPLRGAKYLLYEGGIRVAALAYWPGRPASARLTQPLAIYDLLPTLASVTNVPVPREMTVEGWNFWPALTGGQPLGDQVLYWNAGSQFTLQQGGWKLIHHGASPSDGTDELFNLADDPYEEHECPRRSRRSWPLSSKR